MPRIIYEEQLRYNREYRAKNSERVKARERSNYASSSTDKLESNREYRANNRNAVNVQKEKRRTYVRISDPVARMYKDAKARAKKRNLPFDIEPSDIKLPLCCPLLGVLLVCGPTKKKGVPSPFAPSLDRIRPEKGYVKNNIRVLSHLANTMKNAATPEQLRTFAANVLREHEGRMFSP